MNTAKKIAICGAFCALLVAIQYALSAVKGIELVTVFFFTFSFCFGGICGCAVAISYTLLRSFLFGFFPNITILYLVYYPLFALASGLLGKLTAKSLPKKRLIFSLITVCLFTILFTALDCVITPIFFEYTREAWVAYIIQATPVCLIQSVCAIITTALLFFPLTKTFFKINRGANR